MKVKIRYSSKLSSVCLILLLIVTLLGCGEKIGPESSDLTDDSYFDQKCSTCAFEIMTTDGLFDAKEQGVQPGDTVGIEAGDRGGLKIINVEGTEAKPIIFVNCGGQVRIDNESSNGLSLLNCKYFRLTGLGSSKDKYGFKVTAPAPGTHAVLIQDLSTNIELDHVEVNAGGYGGIVCRSDATCDGTVSINTFTQYNTILHHNYVHDTGGEGFYIGGSHWGSGQGAQPGCQGTILFEPELKGVRVYENITDRTGRDGIQVGSAVEDCQIYKNIVSNYGLKDDYGHLSGFQINPGTTGPLYDNIIIDGHGPAIFMVGRGDNTIYNNIIINPKADGILTGDRDPTSGVGFYVINNTIINPGRHGFAVYSGQTEGSVFYNNIVVDPGGEYFSIQNSNAQYDSSNNYYTRDISKLQFTDPGMNDFSLKESSPAINYGIDVSMYGINEDIEGNPRPVNAYDAGAIEYQN